METRFSSSFVPWCLAQVRSNQPKQPPPQQVQEPQREQLDGPAAAQGQPVLSKDRCGPPPLLIISRLTKARRGQTKGRAKEVCPAQVAVSAGPHALGGSNLNFSGKPTRLEPTTFEASALFSDPKQLRSGCPALYCRQRKNQVPQLATNWQRFQAGLQQVPREVPRPSLSARRRRARPRARGPLRRDRAMARGRMRIHNQLRSGSVAPFNTYSYL